MDTYRFDPLYAHDDESFLFAGSGPSQSTEALRGNHGFSEGSSSVPLSYHPTIPTGGSSGQPIPQAQHSYAPHLHATFYTEDLQPSYFHHDPRTPPVPQMQPPPPLPFELVNSYKPSDHPPPVQKLPTPSEMAIILAPSGQGPLPVPPESQMYSNNEELTVSRERKHACSMCHKRFDRPSTLRKHLLVHTGEKAFKCETCGRRFGVASNLNRHRRRCILKPVNAYVQSSSSAPNTNPTHSGSASDANAPSSSSTRSETRAEVSRPQLILVPPETIPPIDNLLPAPVPSRPKQTRKNPSSNANATSPSSPNTSNTVQVSSPGGGPPPPPPPNQPKRRRRAPSPSRWVPPSLARFILYPPQRHKTASVPLPPVSPTSDPRRPAAFATPSGLYSFSDSDSDRYVIPNGVLTSRTQNSSATSFSYPNYSSHINVTLSGYPNSTTTSNSAQADDTISTLSLDLAYHPREWEQRPILPGPGILSLLSHRIGHNASSTMSGGEGNGNMNGAGMGMFSVFGYRSSNTGSGNGSGRSRTTKGSGDSGSGGRRKASGGSANGGYQLSVSDTSNVIMDPNFVIGAVDIVGPQPTFSSWTCRAELGVVWR